MAGLAAARLHRFDWQPSGRGRVLTTVCVGVTGGAARLAGFSLVCEVSLEGDQISVQPDEILDWVRVLAEG